MLEKRAQIAPLPNGKCRLDKGFKEFVRNYLLIDLFKKQSYFGRSELSNLNEGCKDLPSSERHHLPIEGKFVILNNKTHPNPPLEKEGVNVSCAEHTVKDFLPFTSHFS